MSGRLEHLNVTVADPDATAALLGDLFGWKLRWSGDAIHGGRTVHVGSADSYVAVYTGPGGAARPTRIQATASAAGSTISVWLSRTLRLLRPQ